MSGNSLYLAYVYFLSNKRRTVLYVGVTKNLEKRIAFHRSGLSSFTKRYSAYDLVYYEIHRSIGQAIAREKNIKNWKRAWKDELIKEMNPENLDLAKDWDFERVDLASKG